MNPRRQQLVEAYYKNKITDIEILVDNFANPHDIAAITRSADGLGIKKIYLYYTYAPYPCMVSQGKKSSASANKWILYERVEDLQQFFSQKKDWNFLGLVQQKTSQFICDYEFTEKTILVVPSPEQGLSSELACDHFISPPFLHDASYSTSTAVAMSLYEIFTQHGKHLQPLSSLVPRGKRG
ncbi:TrmH family RNA methyltransferase [Candidatus Uabimicrobium amorphum]|uniref:tRNA (Guanosine(18)-2'-O)-methyltransferase n=1 Tax=Uabimicrobium amorphum TaxID=2596890 RepID=A0A5S9IKP8_UABAM|nr:TrmH family RNA methyltransferase [Candidatus Uabimicrobium amorphum]BBM83653.1 tRNA (guanosine(18)-2'-O)-methyltransferase [Candidatus Uabimicrobium amorphum]